MKLFTRLLVIAVLSINGLNAQTTQSRLVAIAGYINYYVNDSSYLNYNGSNGGDLTHTLKFTNEINYSYNPNPGIDSFATYSLVQQSFDANNNIVQSLSQYWDTSKWVNEYRTVSNFNANNIDTLDTYQLWDSSYWLNSYKYHYGIVNNNVDTIVTENFYPSSWVPVSKQIYTYNVSNYITGNLYQYWDRVKNIWFNSTQTLSYYDGFNNDTADISQFYDTTSKQWTNSSKYISLYNANHNLLIKNFYSWYTGPWTLSGKTIYNYNANSDDTADITLQYNSNVTDTEQQNFYTYNGYNQETSHIFDGSPNFFFEPYMETYFYYSTYTGIEQLPASDDELFVYPNPASGFIHLALTLQQMQPVQLNLYNMVGQQLWNADMGNAQKISATIPVIDLPDGVYILKVNYGSTSQQHEIVVAR